MADDVGEPADDLGQDHARVAARAHQRGPSDLVGEALAVGVVELLEGLLHRAHGQRQIRAGVPVGNRIDVEVVDPAAARLQSGDRRTGEATDRVEVPVHAEAFTASMCTSTAEISRPVIRPTS